MPEYIVRQNFFIFGVSQMVLNLCDNKCDNLITMKQTSVKSGLMKVAVIGVLIMVGCLIFYYINQHKLQRDVERLAQGDRTVLANRIMDVYSKQYSNIVRDNSAWDEFIASFINGINQEWLLNNIGYMLENYNATCVCVFDTTGAVAYQRKEEDSQDIEFFDFGGKSVPELMGDKHFLDFYLRKGNKLYEYHGAAIVSAADMITRQENAKGYLFMIKQISYELLSEYQHAIGNRDIGLVFTKSEIKSTEDFAFPNYLIIKEMKDYNNETVAYIYFVFGNSVVGMFKRFIPIFLLVSLMSLLIVIAIMRYSTVKITRPLHNIAASFDTGKTDKIQPLKKETNEFGVISKMMEVFFTQKDNLARLNADLKQSREEMMVQNEMLQQQKEEISAQHENVLMLNEELSAINEDLAEQKKEVQEAHDQLTSGITYASRLQSAMLQAVEPTNEMFKDFCVVYYPRNIVSGDFYFTRKMGDTIVACLGDCTGHGVPGAMLASMGISFLTQLLLQYGSNELMPDEILSHLKDKVSSALGLDQEGEQRTDGMDVALLIYNKVTRNGYFSGAHRPMVMIRDGEVFTIKGDNIPIGHFRKEGKFTPVSISFQPGDKVYLFSDGCSDQTGGEQKRRLMIQNFRAKLLEFSPMPFAEQKKAIEDLIFGWKGDLQQTDDISLLGFEVA